MGRPGLFTNFRDDPPGCIIHEPGLVNPGLVNPSLVNNGASRVNIAKLVARSREKRGSPRAEGDRARCDAILVSGVE